MADDNQQWPSEDEDFDATGDAAAVQSEDEPTEEPVTVSKPKAVEVETPDDQPKDDEDHGSYDEPATEVPQAAPTPAKVKTPKAPKAPKAPGSVSMGRVLVEVILFVAVVGLGLWAWSLNSDNSDLKTQVAQLNNNPQVAVQKQTNDLISKVGKLLQLPTGETPTIASVTDSAQAKQQSAFFANAQNGDKVLMYVKAGEAILYRPSTNKIVLVAPLTFTNSSATTTPATTTKK